MREAFERAILNHPEDSTNYAVYADWLTEQDDPRGEFMQTQLALENESLPATERKTLQQQEHELLAQHQREWLAELAPFVLDEKEDEPTHTGTEVIWERGLLTGLIIGSLNRAIAQSLATTTAVRFLSELHIHESYASYHDSTEETIAQRVPTPPGMREHQEYFELIGSPFLENLRILRIGNDEPPEDGWTDCHMYSPGIEYLVAQMPRLEELHLLAKEYDCAALFALPNLTCLRVLRMYHLGNRRSGLGQYEYPLNILAANPAFANLTHLKFHPHWAEESDDNGTELSYLPLEQVRTLLRSPHLKSLTHLQLRLSDIGDEGVHELIASGILKRLKWLDLRHGAITDDGARLFAACSDIRNLERLDLTRNAVTATGLGILRAAKIDAVANNPLTVAELQSREYLREGDFE